MLSYDALAKLINTLLLITIVTHLYTYPVRATPDDDTTDHHTQVNPPFYHPHFINIYGRDLSLCKNLTIFYESRLQRDLIKLNLHTLTNENSDGITDYERTDRPGLLKIKIISINLEINKPYMLDILDTGSKQKLIQVNDDSFHIRPLYITIWNHNQKLFPSSEENELLEKWPGFSHSISSFISMSEYQRYDSLIKYKGKYFVISNMYMFIDKPVTYQGIIRVFRISKDYKPRDICYIVPAPSETLRITTGDPYGKQHNVYP